MQLLTLLTINHILFIAVVCLNLVATYISGGNRVLLSGRNTTITCYSDYITPYWHFYSLKPGASPCSFYRPYYGISRCPSASGISVKYLPTSFYRNKTTLTIASVQLADAGTYTCGQRNPNYHYRTKSIIVGVIGKCTLCV